MENKIVNVSLTGGLIGLLFGSPMYSLNKAISKANEHGWEVVQIMPASSGNIFLNILKIFILILTLSLFTIGTGYYLILQRPVATAQREDQHTTVQQTNPVEEDTTEGLFD